MFGGLSMAESVQNQRQASREKALRMFGKHLWNNRSLLEALPLLDGSTLVCHCALTEACHAGIIIEAFEEMRSSDLAALEGPPKDQP